MGSAEVIEVKAKGSSHFFWKGRGAVQAVGVFLLIRFAVALALVGKARGAAFFDVFLTLDVLGCLAFRLSDKEG